MSTEVQAEGGLGNETVLSIIRVSKRFPGVQALADVSIDLRAGEVLGLVGENGAGKSTLIKIVSGVERADSGEVKFFCRDGDRGAGIAVIYQELATVPDMSALSNVFLGDPPHRGPWLNTELMRRRFVELTRVLGSSIDPDARAGSLSVAQQRILEIMRALVAQHRVLIMDEPTASLGSEERKHLYGVIGELRRRGTAIIYITHDLDEVLSLCDRVAIMRDGQLIRCDAAAVWSKERLVTAMVGDDHVANAMTRRQSSDEIVLEVRDLKLTTASPPICFVLNRGEILGIAGLVGAGRTELLRALFGANDAASGSMVLNGRTVPLPRSISEAIAEGIALVPEDRKGQGLVLGLSGIENITLADLNAASNIGIVSPRRQRSVGERLAALLGLSTRRLATPARTLSGGNQQKLVIGKWLHVKPAILLLDEPTRGIDVGAKAEIFERISKLAEQGMSVIIVSSELEELVTNCDRVLVMARNCLLDELSSSEATVERILAIVFEVERVAA